MQQPPAFGYGYPPQQQQQYGGPPQGYGYPGQSVGPQPQFQQPQNQGIFAPQPQNAFPDLPSDPAPPSSSNKPKESQEQTRNAPPRAQTEKVATAKVVPALPLPNLAASPRPKPNTDVSDLAQGVNNLSTTQSATTNGQAASSKRNALLEVQRNMKAPAAAAAPVPSVPSVPSQPKEEAAATRTQQDGASNAPATRGGRRSPNNSRRDPGVRQNGVVVNPEAAIVIPESEYDFSSANAKFSKEGLASAVPAGPVYNKKSSFFDQISSEATDRTVPSSGGGRGRGREMRNQERTMNYETFGEDLAFRNTSRGRGRGGRGRVSVASDTFCLFSDTNRDAAEVEVEEHLHWKCSSSVVSR